MRSACQNFCFAGYFCFTPPLQHAMHRAVDGETKGTVDGDASFRKRPSQGIALEAVFSTASPLPAGGVQLLSHLEGETEAAGALLGALDPEV